MPLKFQMDSVDGIDPAVAALYTETDGGKFVLTGIENVVHKSKIDEFRNNNIALSNQLAKFEGIDPNEVATLRTQYEEAQIKLENAGQVDEETVNKLVETRVAKIKSDTEKTIQDLISENNTLTSDLQTNILNNDISTAAAEHKIDPSALLDVQLRAKQVFKFEDNKPVAYNGDGEKMYSDDGLTPVNINSWVKGLIKTSPHLFQPSVTANLNNNRGGDFKGDMSKLTPLQKIQMGLG